MCVRDKKSGYGQAGSLRRRPLRAGGDTGKVSSRSQGKPGRGRSVPSRKNKQLMQRPCGRKEFGECEGQDVIGWRVWELQARLETAQPRQACSLPLLCGSRRLLWSYRKKEGVDILE